MKINKLLFLGLFSCSGQISEGDVVCKKPEGYWELYSFERSGDCYHGNHVSVQNFSKLEEYSKLEECSFNAEYVYYEDGSEVREAYQLLLSEYNSFSGFVYLDKEHCSSTLWVEGFKL